MNTPVDALKPDTRPANALQALGEAGQSPWLDYLKRSFVASGELAAMIGKDGLKGLTSNPSIFEKAIAESDEYAAAIKAFAAQGSPSITEIYEHLAIADIQAAADVFRPVYDQTDGRDGYVSLECSPYLANDTAATIREAEHLWQAVDRPNLMVKVPATDAGLQAVRAIIGKGINVNVTLLFSVETYRQVAEAYLAGLEDLRAARGDVTRVGSVASFFVSRTDTAVEKAIDKLAGPETGRDLRGAIAIANAKLAYVAYGELFSGARWEALANVGARSQRLLWASTSTKSKALKDTVYVEALIGRDTVDTIPPATLDAFRDHGVVVPDAITRDLDAARSELQELSALGIDLEAISRELVADGVRQFAAAFDQLFAAIARQRREAFPDSYGVTTVSPGSQAAETAFAAEIEAWRKDGLIRRLWAGGASLWTGADEAKWCGWLTVVEQELADLGPLSKLAAEVRREGFSDVVLLGMGGSSLGPQVLAEVLGDQPSWPRFHMLDSTDPAQIADLEAAITLDKALFIVSSKSGSTLEPNIFADYFWDRAKAASGDGVARQFVAVTDAGSSLEQRAKQDGWAGVFYGVPAIGGRYSVLSKFGLVPGAAIGLDVAELLNRTLPMIRACGADVPPEENPGVQLGVALGVAARVLGRDKVTIVASSAIAPLGAWLEQLLAESTGKQGRGLIPVAGEPLGAPELYGADRIFAYVELAQGFEPAQRAAVEALAKAGHPVVTLTVPDKGALGQEFFRWEVAIAVAGAIIGINPFDQPDVEASKDKTRALTEAYEKGEKLPEEQPLFAQDGVAIYADPGNAAALGRHDTLEGWLKSHFARLGAGDYAAFLAYIDRTDEATDLLTAIREQVRDRTRAATCVGFGPRFQHSTGQAYKGGPNTGVFLQITCDDARDIAVPGHRYSFGVVKAAQARGDLAVLVERKRRAMRIHLHNAQSGLARLAGAIHDALP